MLNKVLLTPVDELVEIVKKNPNCTISYVKQQLKVPQDVLERWIVVLDEYNILKVEYKGFEGFLKISKGMEEKEKDERIDVDKLKTIYVQKCKDRNYSSEKMKMLWPVFLQKYESEIKALFEDKAKQKGYKGDKIEMAWKKYRRELNQL